MKGILASAEDTLEDIAGNQDAVELDCGSFAPQGELQQNTMLCSRCRSPRDACEWANVAFELATPLRQEQRGLGHTKLSSPQK